MRRHGWLVLGLCLWVTAAGAQDALRVGVYLPASIADADERFQFGETLAANLTSSLGPVSARSFARYEDFAKAAESGELDLGVVDGFIAAQDRLEAEPLALATRGGDARSAWVIVSRKKEPVAKLAGAQLAMVRGPGGSAAFLQQLVLGGELPANHFKVVPVPAVESALKMLSAGSVEAALVPEAIAPQGAHVIYRSRPVPGPIVVSFKGNADAQRKAVLGQKAAPFTQFVRAGGAELREARLLLRSGGVRSVPFMVEGPGFRLKPEALSREGKAEPALPDFTAFIEPAGSHPDD